MEITKDILINTNNLNVNSEIEIQYFGELKKSENIYIKYGYNPNSFEYEKQKLDEKNSAKIKIKKPGYFYFYFIDNNGNKDNNFYKDYQLYIKKSNLILTQNSSMKENPYRYFSHINNIYKTFYTPLTFKNTTKPEEIILPRALKTTNPSAETNKFSGYIIEPIKNIQEYNITQALIPTESIGTLFDYKIKKTNSLKKIKSINKLLSSVQKLFGLSN